MSALTVFKNDNPKAPVFTSTDREQLAGQLAEVGVRFEHWVPRHDIEPGAANDVLLDAFAEDIDRIVAEGGYQTVDVISLSSDNPDKAALRSKFLDEHHHTEDEVRFFVAGRGLFSLHMNDCVYEVLCEKGDLISVPANTKHWFDMGPNPEFIAIRFFNNPEGWVAQYSGSDIANKFSRLD